MYGLYIHIPFCEQKCKYCDFLSYPGHQKENKERYIEALMHEMSLRLKGRWQVPDTIFMGGGTPTALSSMELQKILDHLNTLIDLSKVQEFTCEANPGTVDEEKLYILKNGGVNRLSFGVQSFDDVLLRRIGRIHSAQEAIEAVCLAKQVGFQNINIDLMYGLPGQSKKQWYNTIETALSLGTQHLSLYQLILEPYTAIVHELENNRLPPIDEDGAAQWFEEQREWIARAGYMQYEISNYALCGFESKHNQIYWDLDDYLGLGLGATSWERPIRRVNTSNFSSYVGAYYSSKDVPCSEERITIDDQMSESVFMALRMNRGLSRQKFKSLYNKDVTEVFAKAIEEGIKNQWLTVSDSNVALTNIGRNVGNWVFELFI